MDTVIERCRYHEYGVITNCRSGRFINRLTIFLIGVLFFILFYSVHAFGNRLICVFTFTNENI